LPELAVPPHDRDGRSTLAVAEEAVRAAGAAIVRRLPEMTGPRSESTVRISNKGAWNDLVTDVDREAEAAALGVIRAQFPNDAILAEESGSREGSTGYEWCLDPLDGTRNFASGIPHLAVNLALARDGETLVGLTFDPVRDELFQATLGGGTWLNGRQMHVSEETELRQCILGFDMGYVDEQGRMLLEMLQGLWPGLQSLRMMGSAALGMAYVAVGRIHVYANHHNQPWDVAPGLLMVRESGGMATDLQGAPAVPESGRLIAASPAVHAAFMSATKGTPWRLA
jgi:myo-inositol-1(or 4)-monophosphatase